MKNIFKSLLLFSTAISVAQSGGFWDKERATNKEIIVGAGNRMLIPTEALPTGTTEVVYRITLLDENQQMANSLVSILKAIPDPTGISQGSAGAVFLLSKISGDDKCKYAIFPTKESAQAYQETGKPEKACVNQEIPINKDAKRLSLTSACLKSNVIWFGFESSNWIMKQRIVLEVVPWVDSKLSRGWSLENRKSVLAICKTTERAKKLPDPDGYCVCVLDKIQDKYRFADYQNLLAEEKTKVYKDAGNSCFTETDAAASMYEKARLESAALAKQSKYPEAISRMQPVFNDGKATVSDYAAMASLYIFTKQYNKAIQVLREGEKLDDSNLLIQLNLAHAHLLRGDYSHAKSIYKKYKAQNVTDNLSWNEEIATDFEAFKKAGLPSEDFERILHVVE